MAAAESISGGMIVTHPARRCRSATCGAQRGLVAKNTMARTKRPTTTGNRD